MAEVAWSHYHALARRPATLTETETETAPGTNKQKVSDDRSVLSVFEVQEQLHFFLGEGEQTESLLSVPARALTQYTRLSATEREVLKQCRQWILEENLPVLRTAQKSGALFLFTELHRLLLSTLIDKRPSVDLRSPFMQTVHKFLDYREAASSHWETEKTFTKNFSAVEPILAEGCLFWSHENPATGKPVLICQMGKLIHHKPGLNLALEFCASYAIYNLCSPGIVEQVEIVLDMEGTDIATWSLTEMIEFCDAMERMMPGRVSRTFVVTTPFSADLVLPLFVQFLSPHRLKQFSFLALEQCGSILQSYVAKARLSRSLYRFWPFPLRTLSIQNLCHTLYECLGVSWWKEELENIRVSFHNEKWILGKSTLSSAAEIESLIIDGKLPLGPIQCLDSLEEFEEFYEKEDSTVQTVGPSHSGVDQTKFPSKSGTSPAGIDVAQSFVENGLTLNHLSESSTSEQTVTEESRNRLSDAAVSLDSSRLETQDRFHSPNSGSSSGDVAAPGRESHNGDSRLLAMRSSPSPLLRRSSKIVVRTIRARMPLYSGIPSPCLRSLEAESLREHTTVLLDSSMMLPQWSLVTTYRHSGQMHGDKHDSAAEPVQRMSLFNCWSNNSE